MIRALVTAAAALLLLFSTSAFAGPGDSGIQPPPPGQPQIFAQSEPKPGFGAIEVDASCEKPAHDGESTCTSTLQLVVNGAIVDSRVVTMPVAGDDVVYDVDVSKIRDKALTSGGKISENLKAYSADGSVFLNQTPRTDSAFAGWDVRIAQKCIKSRAIAALTPVTVATKPGQNVPKLALTGVVPTYSDFTTPNTGGTLIVKLNGLIYAFGPNTTARFDCITFFSNRGPFLVPAVFVGKGDVTVSGKPVRQFSTAVVTPEGTFRSLNREAVNFVISREARAKVSQMNVVKGKTLEVTSLQGVSGNFPCTPGRSIRVGRHGPIK